MNLLHLFVFFVLLAITNQSPVPSLLVSRTPAEQSVSHESAWKSKGEEILGDQCRSDGDVMSITYCYCGAPDYEDWEGPWPEGHYVQVDYFNHNMNQTFHINETCVSDKRMDCLGHKWEWQNTHDLDSPTGRENREYGQDEWGPGYREIQWNGACGFWSAASINNNGYHVHHSPWDGNAPYFGVLIDKFCFFPNPGYVREYPFNEGYSDRVYFNGQRRWLRDGQGFTDFADEMARDICTELCPVRTGLPMMTWNKDHVPSHQACALDLDDMCEHCK